MILLLLATFLSIGFFSNTLNAQDKKDKTELKSEKAKTAFIQSDASMAKMFANAWGYVIFPSVGKGAVVVGGASGNGTVYEKGKVIGTAHMVQASVGPQIGGKAYREVIFFETKAALDRFCEKTFAFSAEVAAVAVKSGVSANARYAEGVAVFTQAKGGLMADVSVGGQKFTFKDL